MLRKNWVFWLNSTLLHGIVIVLLWFPQPLHFPTRADVMDAWKNAALYFERTLHPEQFARAEQETKAAAQQRIAQLPPALITRAKPLNKVIQIRCPKDARMAKLHGNVFLTADIDAQGRLWSLNPRPTRKSTNLSCAVLPKHALRLQSMRCKNPRPIKFISTGHTTAANKLKFQPFHLTDTRLMNSFNLQHFWQQGDSFAHFVAIVLLIMSILSWGVIALRTMMVMRMRHLSDAIESFWDNMDSDTQIPTMQKLDRENLVTPLAMVAKNAPDTSTLERKLSSAVRQSEHTLEQGLTLLATVASSAPFVGLLGTVWGIYRTLTTVAADGQMDINAIIGPVGEALIMTAFGLAVALPALFAYNFFSRKNQTQSNEIDAFAHDLVAICSERKGH